MVIYADEDYYKKEYLQGKAAVITAAFPYYSREASQVIKKYVFDNIDDENPPEEVKMCCCEIAELAYKRDQSAQSDGVSSESVQGWSKSYESTESRRNAFDKAVRECILQAKQQKLQVLSVQLQTLKGT